MKKIFLLFLVYWNFTYAFDIGGSAGGVELFKFNIDLSGLFASNLDLGKKEWNKGNYTKSAELFQKACNNDEEALACRIVAEMYLSGYVFQKNEEIANKFFQKSCYLGDKQSCDYKVTKKEYDLKINKYVGKDQTQSDTKTYTGTNTLSLKAGDFAYYRIDYKNLSTSTATPVGTKVYDDYDQTKIAITWLPDACSHDGDRIICTGYDLSPNQYHTFYYIAKIKADVVANTIIVNNAEIRPTTDDDTNDANDHTNAQVKIIESGVCGGGAKTYPATTTAYPFGTVFCMKGTTTPFNPIFPKKGLSSSWLCKSKLGGIDTNCIANREYSTKYDLKIDKYVGKDINEVNLGKKEIVTKQGDKIIYKLFYTNLSSSSSTTVGTKIYDDYDETKITIVSKPQECTDDGTKLICVGYDLQPSQSHVFYYTAQVKTTISNGVKIHNNVKIKASGENDTNPANDISNARVTVNTPLNGECGTPARTYLSKETQYPAGSIFCNKGTANPSSPYFPLVGQSITWTCQGVNGELSRVCQASRTDNY